jgi:PiT family inorganic phosphate transporter
VTLPAAAPTGAVAWKATDVLGDAGFVAVFGVLGACAVAFYVASRRSPVGPANVNDEWTGSAPTRQTASAGV